jgi:hypothetical protein
MPFLRSFAVNSDGRSYKDLAPPEQFSLTLNAYTPIRPFAHSLPTAIPQDLNDDHRVRPLFGLVRLLFPDFAGGVGRSHVSLITQRIGVGDGFALVSSPPP